MEGLEKFQKDIITDKIAKGFRDKILDNSTQAEEVYDPKGLESLETYVQMSFIFSPSLLLLFLIHPAFNTIPNADKIQTAQEHPRSSQQTIPVSLSQIQQP